MAANWLGTGRALCVRALCNAVVALTSAAGRPLAALTSTSISPAYLRCRNSLHNGACSAVRVCSQLEHCQGRHAALVHRRAASKPAGRK